MKIKDVETYSEKLSFEISNIELPFINGIRRTILSDIPVVGMKAFPDSECDISIVNNDTGINNEIIKHRLSCIPIHVLNEGNITTWQNLKIILNVKNAGETIIPVTSEHISMIDKTSGNKISDAMVRRIFPPDGISGDYILIAYLKPVNSKIQKENQLNFESNLSLVNPTISSVYNCVSNVNFSNTIDLEMQEYAWSDFEKTLPPTGNMELEKKNWKFLQGQRYYKENTFDVTIKTSGFYSNKQILNTACDIISNKLNKIYLKNGIEIKKTTKSNIPNAYDIVLHNNSYTIGNILKRSMYTLYYGKTVNYVGFMVEHPHDTYSVLRVGFNELVDDSTVDKTLMDTCTHAIDVIKRTQELFESSL
jgi:DNA-directed RNA polymerase subunit L